MITLAGFNAVPHPAARVGNILSKDGVGSTWSLETLLYLNDTQFCDTIDHSLGHGHGEEEKAHG